MTADPLTGDSIWVTSECSVDGVYFAAVTLGDRIHPLDRDTATRYAEALLAVSEEAVHDAAVVSQLRELNLTDEAIAMSVKDLRSERPPIDQGPCGPFRFEPVISSTTGLPYVHVSLDGAKVSQWTPRMAREHAAFVAAAPFACDLDQALVRYLVACDVDEARARAVVGDLGRHRRDEHDGRPT